MVSTIYIPILSIVFVIIIIHKYKTSYISDLLMHTAYNNICAYIPGSISTFILLGLWIIMDPMDSRTSDWDCSFSPLYSFVCFFQHTEDHLPAALSI